MSIPLIIFLYIYIFAGAIFVLGSIFVLYHILRFGLDEKVVTFSSVAYIAVSAIIILISVYKIARVDWSLVIDISLGLGIL